MAYNDPFAGLTSPLLPAPFADELPGVTGMDAVPKATPPAEPHQSVLAQLGSLLPQLITAFGAGQAARQRNPEALARIIGQYAQGQEAKRRGKLADEAQRLREEREQRLAEQATARDQRLLDNDTTRTEQATAAAERQRINDLNTLLNSMEDNTRGLFTGGQAPAPAALEEYISQNSDRVKALGGDPQKAHAMLLALITQLGQKKPDVPYIERAPGTPAPATVPAGAMVRNAPQPRVPREAPKPNSYNITEADGTIYRVIEDPHTGREISRTRVGARPKSGGNDPLAKIIEEASRGGGAAASPAAASPASGRKSPIPTIGDVVTVRGQKMRITAIYPGGRFDAVPVK